MLYQNPVMWWKADPPAMPKFTNPNPSIPKMPLGVTNDTIPAPAPLPNLPSPKNAQPGHINLLMQWVDNVIHWDKTYKPYYRYTSTSRDFPRDFRANNEGYAIGWLTTYTPWIQNTYYPWKQARKQPDVRVDDTTIAIGGYSKPTAPMPKPPAYTNKYLPNPLSSTVILRITVNLGDRTVNEEFTDYFGQYIENMAEWANVWLYLTVGVDIEKSL